MNPSRFRPALLGCLVLPWLLLALSTRPAWAAEPPSAGVPPVDQKVGELMQDRNYAEAVAAIDEAGRADDAPRDYLAYLEGRAHFLAGELDEAVAALDGLLKQFPQSPWIRRARFAKAMALARKGDFRGAELIYRAEAEYRLSTDRMHEIAGIYLEFADCYFKPAAEQEAPEGDEPLNEDEKPDYEKALEFYNRALEAGPKPDVRIEVEFRVARCHQELGKLDEAAKRYARLIDDHPKSPLAIEARFRRGECLLANDKPKEARRVWQDLLAEHADAVSERIAEAAYQVARTWGVPKPADDEDLDLGVAALEAFLKRFPEHELASQAHLDVARSYVHRGRHEEAVVALTGFLGEERYQDRDEIPEARALLGRSYQLQKKYDEALASWAAYLAKHPADKAWSWVQRQIVETEYLKGEEKYEAEQYDDARKLWSAFLAKYPLDARGPKILFRFGQIRHNEKQWEAAITAWRRVASKYPKSKEAAEARILIAATLELELGKLEEALKEYGKITSGNHYPEAAQAIARLISRSLTVATERVFRSDEPPQVKLTTRNVESVTVRVYEVDLETYFRKMHLARGVEKLDIALIDPDHTFEFQVPDYEKYRQFESTIELPSPGDGRGGVTAVTVSSKTREATTLVIRSDLDVIVKSSRDEVFVFAENMRTGKPWPGARLLVSNGRQVFAEAVTGDDGVLQKAYKELRNAGDVRVFAVADGHVASNVVGLEGVGVAQGLSNKGYIYTDRPAYRAGQLVCVRGLVRRAVGDAYRVDEGKAYTLEVFDNRDRLLRRQKVTLGPFGSFQDRFMLPPTSPQGQYRVMISDAVAVRYRGDFRVHEYRLEPIRLVVDTPQKVYYRGEEIEGTIRAEYYYGAPLAGREIRYQLAEGRLFTARTDEKGEIHFKLPTREFRETQVLPFQVSLPERNLSQTENFLLATQGFGIEVTSIRPVYVAGETFEVTVRTSDAENDPVARKLALKVLEQTTVEGKVGERLVEEHPLETDAAEGLSRKTLKLQKGGQYVFRAEGIDRFENPVSGTLSLEISDDDDDVRLRILADRHTFKVGDTAQVNLHWREDPALALVTFQGARVLDYRLVRLEKGANGLSIPMIPRLAPNFELSVAVMTDPRERLRGTKGTDPHLSPLPEGEEEETARRFHEAASPFTVRRELSVAIAMKAASEAKGPVRPGDKLEVTVTTTDPQGKPVAAEVSLAMVEQALLDRFEWPVEPIQEFFRGQRREPAVRTTSSITFAYHPSTQAINPRLLDEEERLELVQEEETSLREAQARAGLEGGYIGGMRGMGGMGGGFGGAGFGGPAYHPAGSPPPAIVDHPYEFAGDPFAANPFADDDFDVDAPPEGAVAVERYGGSKASGRGEAMVRFNSFVDESTVNAIAGSAALSDFDANLSLIVTQWQEVDEEAALAKLMIHETAYWNPAIVTGDDGKTTVTLTVPDRSTAWSLLAKGITVDTLAGETTDRLVVKKDLFGQLKLPASFTEGDRAELLASVHNDAVEKGRIDVTLKTTVGGRTVEQRKTLDVEAKGIHELSFEASFGRPDSEDEADPARLASDTTVAFELTVAAGGSSDVVRRAVPLKPFGVPVFAAASGSAAGDTTAWVEAPKNMPVRGRSLEILVGPTVERSLLDVVLAPAVACQIESYRFTSGLETATSDLMASLALKELVSVTREAGGPEAESLDGRVRGAVSLLVSSQNGDGGWSWTGRAEASNRYSTARVVWALSLARAAGYLVPDATHDKAVGYLRQQMAATGDNDLESKAILLHALTKAGHSDFGLANRLYRNRPSLSTAAVAYLALTFADMDRKTTAGELLELAAAQNLDNPSSRRQAPDGSLPWSHSPVELRALYAVAIQKAVGRSPEAQRLVDWLLTHRLGNRWSPEKATGPAALALCRWYAESRFEDEHYRLAVFVNDVQAKVLEVDAGSGTQRIDVPTSALEDGKQRITFQLTGRGRYTYQCILSGFVPADKLRSTTTDWVMTRAYQPAPLEVDGREVPRGFGVVQGDVEKFRNPLTELAVGRRGAVELNVRREVSASVPEEQLEYLVITEPIPSGTTVIEQSVKGPFERFEIGPGAITFFVGNRRSIGTIRYELLGYLPGEYRAGATVIRNAHRPEQMVTSGPKPLVVLPLGAKSSDPYRLTPQELLDLGKHDFEKGRFERSAQHLTELIDGWSLQPKVYKEVVKMLLDAHLKLESPAQVVRFFEIVMEKWPDEQIPFDKSLEIAAAYHEIGEYERSYLSFRAILEARFLREGGVAGVLESQGEFLRSVDVMQRILREYPPEPYAAAADYSLAQRVYSKAAKAADDPKLRKAKVNRVDLVRRSSDMLESFLTAYPDDPAADQAAFAKANAMLELETFDEAAAACDRYATRYPKSKLLDSFWYIIGYCRFATGKHEAALEMCRKVDSARRIDEATGRPMEIPNRWRAVYIMGQVYHSLGRAAEAVAEYRRVESRFDDAKRSIQYFLRKAIELPEITTVKPGEKVEVKLGFRNVAACQAKVYRIDLMKFTLLRQSLGGITQINLAGIRPIHETRIELGDGLDYRDRTHALSLPLTEEGAYLVVARGGDLHSSGLVLVTPLAVEVQHDAQAAQVRATVKDAADGRYLSDVHVKVIGSGNQDFVSGSTDLRGVFSAEGIQGAPTVIAEAGPGRYAFFRSPAAPFYPFYPTDVAAQPGIQARLYQPGAVELLSPTENELRIRQALDSPTAFEFIDTPLDDAMRYLRRFHQIEIKIDGRALDDVGIPSDTPITQSLRGVSLRSGLRLLLRPLDLTYAIQDEVLLITTPEEAEMQLKTVVYPVSDLVIAVDKSGERWADYDTLIETISSTVQPDTWDDVGGPGSIAPMQYGDTDVIVLSQTDEVHEEIAELLERLRGLAGTKKGDGKPPVRERPRMPPGGF
ncbi:MAG: tetratricopeptide repeat protein, partial [Planctomycetota bacterium]